ncbi:MAG TPA: hypothetical protein VFX29_05700 [Longimicrobiaceae bacterium]|nr:hypothetical protein [Longimicrobiaceae bacterium]
MVEQRGLADAGLAAEDEHCALPAPSMLELPLQQLALAVPALQHGAQTIRRPA